MNSTAPQAPPLLDVEDLRVEYPSARGPVRAVDGVSFSIREGETYALVGESGCGKTATALALLRLVEPGRITGGRIRFEGRDLLELTEREMRRIRGARIGMVFQEAAASLNPVMRVGAQIVEAVRIHNKIPRREAWRRAEELLRMVSMPDPAATARAYPHQLSGGMQQRVMLAIALACSPRLLVADEPTTALDVTLQAQILDLLDRLKEDLGLTVLMIAHDMGVVAQHAQRVGVMYAGRIVEEAPAGALFADPRHPYTRGLLRSVPGLHRPTTGRRRLETLPGSVPDPVSPPPGCRFHPRCPDVMEVCRSRMPADIPVAPGRRAACFLYAAEEIREEGAGGTS